MKVLITGGAGFIGSHLAERLLSNGDEVVIIDDLSTGSEDNIVTLADNPNFKAHFDTVENTTLLEKCIAECDMVYHLAAAVGVKKIIDDPIGSMKRNISCTELVLERANKYKRRILMASTSEVYGKGVNHVFSETDDLAFGVPTKLRWSYACSKAIDEFLCLAYHKHHGLPVVVTRFFNVVGPRQTHEYGMVIPSFMQQALDGRDVTIFGDGLQTRCFCHVNDAVTAITNLMGVGESAYGQIFNIGSDEEVSMVDLARRIIRMVDSQSKIIHIPYDKVYNAKGAFEDIMRRMPSLSKIHEAIGFVPRHNLDDILEDVHCHITGGTTVVPLAKHLAA